MFLLCAGMHSCCLFDIWKDGCLCDSSNPTIIRVDNMHKIDFDIMCAFVTLPHVHDCL